MEEVINNVRACLQTTKGGIPVNALNANYRMLEGEVIPYARLGFKTLEDFLKKDPRLRIVIRGGQRYVEVIPDKNTAHLAELVNRQRSPRRRKRPVSFRRPIINNFNRYNPTNNMRPPPPMRTQMYAKPSSQRPQLSQSAMPVKVYPPGVSQPVSPLSRQKSNLNMTTHNSPSRSPVTPQSAPVHSVNMNPFKDNLSANNAGRQVSRQNSLPQVTSSDRRANVRQIPPLKVARPISERLVKAGGTPLTPPPEERKDPREELSILVQSLNLHEPEFKHVRNVGRGGKVSVFSQVKVKVKVKLGPEEHHIYSSYPHDADNAVEADKLAAARAVHDLHRLYAPLMGMRVTTNKEIIQQRLLAIIDVHPNGVFMDKLPSYYEGKHDETLPPDWVSVLEGCSQLSLEKGVEDSIIVSKNSEPSANVTPSTSTVYPLDLQPRTLSPPVTPHLSPSKTENAFSTCASINIPPLVLPSEHLWPVYVSHVVSISEIWIRLVEDDNFHKMSQQLINHYSTITEPAPSVEILNHYVMKAGEEYVRVLVEAVDLETGEADVFFIDTGEDAVVKFSKLFPLKSNFSNYPAQAIRVSLSTTEELAVCHTTLEIAEKWLLDRAFYVEVISREEDNVSHSVVGIFYDTSTDEDIQINELITQEVHKIMELKQLDVKLAIKGPVLEVFISHIEHNGDVYLQSKNDGLVIIETMLNSLLGSVAADEEKKKRARVSSGPLDPNELYLAHRPDNNWVRVQVAFRGTTNSKMRMVDYGGLLDVGRVQLLKLTQLSQAIARFPVQAVQVELANVKKASFRMAARLHQLASPDEPLLCKVVQGRESSRPAIVELFKRSQPDNLLISINHTLELELELANNGDGNNNVKPKRRLERTISRTTSVDDSVKSFKPPKIPPVGAYFEVHVTSSVANPGNFVVQPFEDKSKLEALMRNMQETYQVNNGMQLSVDSLREGQICAAKINDGLWYRASINRVISEQSVAIYLCDLGNLNLVGMNDLQVLKREFLDLPYQAIKSTLVGIRPTNGDWSIDTCVPRFQELIGNKDFVSMVKKLQPADRVSTDLVLGLDLIDVFSKDVDIHIHEILIEEGHAIPDAQ